MFIICKQQNGQVLKSLTPSCLGRNWEKKLTGPGPGQHFVFRFGPGRARTEISSSLLSQPELGPKFQFIFREVQGLNRNFNFSFGLGQARTEISIFLSGRVGSEPEKYGSWRLLGVVVSHRDMFGKFIGEMWRSFYTYVLFARNFLVILPDF